jgi:DNA-binding transcriptional LysR family regulator
VATVPGIGIDGEHMELFVDHYVCLVSPDNSALVDGNLSWEAFQSLPQAICDFGQAHVNPAERKMRELGFSRSARVTTASFMPLPSIVAGTDLVAVVPSRLAARFGPLTNTIAVDAPFGHVEIIETPYWHPTHNTDSAHQWLREVFRGDQTRNSTS